ncbi:hypothetical protein [Paragemmobacter ruber]|uniref:Uncharacterized protein n=1 Tax=Paragemmobacter ruber TaxID=1985673 RepID=A0ABW9Y252_9RHOB|nr:hypothetical protein [Rhodobacter ruber]NBE05960.1 hypothetical protein [Rhodobacter ruber]
MTEPTTYGENSPETRALLTNLLADEELRQARAIVHNPSSTLAQLTWACDVLRDSADPADRIIGQELHLPRTAEASHFLTHPATGQKIDVTTFPTPATTEPIRATSFRAPSFRTARPLPPAAIPFAAGVLTGLLLALAILQLAFALPTSRGPL